MALIVYTAQGPNDWGVLHHNDGRLARFPSLEICERMALEVLTRAAAQKAAGLLDPLIINVELVCYQPPYA